MSELSDKHIQAAFEAGVILKGVGALVECVAGLSLYLVNVDWLTRLAARVAEHELIGHPRDRIANALMHWAENYSGGGKTFAGLYLLSHGVVKLFWWLNSCAIGCGPIPHRSQSLECSSRISSIG